MLSGRRASPQPTTYGSKDSFVTELHHVRRFILRLALGLMRFSTAAVTSPHRTSKALAPTCCDTASSSVTKPRQKQSPARSLLREFSLDCRCHDFRSDQ